MLMVLSPLLLIELLRKLVQATTLKQELLVAVMLVPGSSPISHQHRIIAAQNFAAHLVPHLVAPLGALGDLFVPRGLSHCAAAATRLLAQAALPLHSRFACCDGVAAQAARESHGTRIHPYRAR